MAGPGVRYRNWLQDSVEPAVRTGLGGLLSCELLKLTVTNYRLWDYFEVHCGELLCSARPGNDAHKEESKLTSQEKSENRATASDSS